MKISYDLHLHSCVSPCGDMEMTPNNIVNMAALIGLDVIAVSDHNTAANLPAVFAVAQEVGILVIPAIEVCTAEEVHVLCLFEELSGCIAFGEYLYEHLPAIQNQPEIFGEQVILDQEDDPIGQLDKLLINAVSLSIDDLLAVLPQYKGHAIPAHVDKQSYSIIANLGFIPPDYNFACVEVKHPPFDTGITANIITNSDAHQLLDISQGEQTLEVDEKSVRGVLQALGFKTSENG